ncbi:HAD family hydrolase [Terrabacter sp. AAH1]|nr:HAD family hydrolase [Terrabacter sp. 28]
MTSPRWSTAVFDLDGTLADTINLIVESYQYAFRTVIGREEDPDVIRSWIGRPLIGAFRDHSPEHADELYATYLQWNADNTERLIRDYDGVVAVLADLRAAGVAVGVATSKRRESAEQAMDILGISEHVEVLVAMEDTERHKPDPTPLLLALERMGRSANGAVYVGDAVVDVLAGKAAGMDTVAVTWGAGLPEPLEAVRPSAVVTTADELRSTLIG